MCARLPVSTPAARGNHYRASVLGGVSTPTTQGNHFRGSDLGGVSIVRNYEGKHDRVSVLGGVYSPLYEDTTEQSFCS